jgi:ubiquinone/menaquinone biosynthesis C-methylase UbiE
MAPDTIEPERGDRARTAEYFSRLADTYGDGAYYGSRRAAVMRAIASELDTAHDVLDLGCGNGEYLREFACAPVSMLVGADLTFEMIATARARVPVARVVRADASVLPFQGARFDIVFCSHVLQFVGDDLDLTLDEITRCLRPGGALIATLPGDSIVRREIESLLGAERYAEFAQLVFRRGSRRNRAGHEERFRSAFERSKLDFTTRHAPFTISWPDIVQWIRIRWIPVVPESDRGPIEPILAEISSTARERTFSMVESLAIGRKS